MAAIEISCSQCGSNEYRLIDERTGEIACLYCRGQWVVPELARKSETEKFLDQQAQQPRVTYDNTTETDQQLMSMITSMVSGGNLLRGAFATLRRALRTFLIIIAIVAVVVIAILIYTRLT
jgi:uncharacterized Zn finger protein (UPF0148 family)